MSSIRGKFLVASPHLQDPNFQQTVVFMIEHNDEGALGVILNRPADLAFSELWNAVSTAPLLGDARVLLGGPVSGYLICLHSAPEETASEVIPGVRFTSDPLAIQRVLLEAQGECRIFWGYAGWGAGQLESEMEVGGWLVVDAQLDAIFADDVGDVWRMAVSAAGESLLRDCLHLPPFPDPEWN